jgi:hypothetical protein
VFAGDLLVGQKILQENNGKIFIMSDNNKVNWDNVSMYEKYSEEFIREFYLYLIINNKERACKCCGIMNDIGASVCWGFTCGIKNPTEY